jgi:hypothetical protein
MIRSGGVSKVRERIHARTSDKTRGRADHFNLQLDVCLVGIDAAIDVVINHFYNEVRKFLRGLDILLTELSLP